MKEAHTFLYLCTSEKKCSEHYTFPKRHTHRITGYHATILDFAGIPIPDGVDGFSLAPEILGEEKNEREFLHGEHSFHSSLSSQFIVTKTDKYIWYSEK